MSKHEIYTIENGIIETDFVGFDILQLSWHRLDGPADIEYDENGSIKKETYWINDTSYSKESYYKKIMHLKIQYL